LGNWRIVVPDEGARRKSAKAEGEFRWLFGFVWPRRGLHPSFGWVGPPTEFEQVPILSHDWNRGGHAFGEVSVDLSIQGIDREETIQVADPEINVTHARFCEVLDRVEEMTTEVVAGDLRLAPDEQRLRAAKVPGRFVAASRKVARDFHMFRLPPIRF
jgi:hypothetical protein